MEWKLHATCREDSTKHSNECAKVNEICTKCLFALALTPDSAEMKVQRCFSAGVFQSANRNTDWQRQNSALTECTISATVILLSFITQKAHGRREKLKVVRETT
jgi:hypothetical protein